MSRSRLAENHISEYGEMVYMYIPKYYNLTYNFLPNITSG